MKKILGLLLALLAVSPNSIASDHNKDFVGIEAGTTNKGARVYLKPFQGFMNVDLIEDDVKALMYTLASEREMGPRFDNSPNRFSWSVVVYEKEPAYEFAGIIQAVIATDFDVRGEYAEVEFYVHPSFRQQGIAYTSSVALMKHMIREDHAPQLLGFVLAVAEGNFNCRGLMKKFENEFDFRKSLLPAVVGENVTFR